LVIFAPGSSHIAHVPVSNPTGAAWTYNAELYLVKDGKYTSSGIISFTLLAGASDTIDFPITMPAAAGTYKVYIDAYVDGVLIAAYQAIEDITITAPVGEFTYSNLSCETVRIPGEAYFDQWLHVEVDIENTGSVRVTRTIAVWITTKFASDNYKREVHANACGYGRCPYCKDPTPLELTLNPGETYHYCFCSYRVDPGTIYPVWMQDDKGWVSGKCYG